jgi:HSP20 family protein
MSESSESDLPTQPPPQQKSQPPTQQQAQTPAQQQAQPPAQGAETRPQRRDPFDMLADMQDEMTRLWNTWPFARAWRRSAGPRSVTEWTPRVDMFDRNGTIVVKAELPGVKREDIEVTVDDGDLVIRGTRQEEQEVKEENFYRLERASGQIYRRIPLPDNVNLDAIDASLNDGVLEVTIPKSSTEQPAARKITIK